MTKPKKGQTFIHDKFVDTSWKPNPGQKWKDAPKAEMVITSVWSTKVYYGFAPDGKGLQVMDMNEFVERFGGQL